MSANSCGVVRYPLDFTRGGAGIGVWVGSNSPCVGLKVGVLFTTEVPQPDNPAMKRKAISIFPKR
jgi:hypothetical protein